MTGTLRDALVTAYHDIYCPDPHDAGGDDCIYPFRGMEKALAHPAMAAIAEKVALADAQQADLLDALDRRNVHSAGDLFRYECQIGRESIARGKPWIYADDRP